MCVNDNDYMSITSCVTPIYTCMCLLCVCKPIYQTVMKVKKKHGIDKLKVSRLASSVATNDDVLPSGTKIFYRGLTIVWFYSLARFTFF